MSFEASCFSSSSEGNFLSLSRLFGGSGKQKPHFTRSSENFTTLFPNSVFKFLILRRFSK